MPTRLLILAGLLLTTLFVAASWPAPAVAAAPARARPQPPYGEEEEEEAPIRPYKGIAIAFITDIAEGRIDAAIEAANERLAKTPGDSETLYSLAVAYSAKKQPDKAMEYVRQAVEKGFPFARFYAGPRDLLAPLLASSAFKQFAADHPVQLVHGPMLGAMTDTSVKVWVRCAAEMPVQVVASTSADFSDAIKSPVVKVTPAADHTAVAELTGLKPSTTYHYQVLLDGKPVKIDPAPTFRTFPPAGAKTKFQVIFGGGAGYTPAYEHMWNTLRSHHPTAFLTLGDNVYIDHPKAPDTQRYCYYRRQSRPEYRRFVACTPTFAIWDDHDFGTNDCHGSPGIDDIPWKVPVWKIFKQNFVNPSYGFGDKQPGVWYDFNIDSVHFIMLDCRFYRTSPRGPSPTMIGPVQKKWLFERLKASKTSGATFTVLVSSVPWSPGTKGGSKDTWDGFPAERQEIWDFIKDNRIEGVFLISADRHRSDAYKNDRPGAYPLYEASSSKLTNVHTHPLIKKALFGYNKKCSFGLLTFDTAAPDPQLIYDVYNIDNKKQDTLVVKRSELSFK